MASVWHGASTVVVVLALGGCGTGSGAGSPSETLASPATPSSTTATTPPGVAPTSSTTATTPPTSAPPSPSTDAPATSQVLPGTSLPFVPMSVPTTVMPGDPGSPPVTVDLDYLAGVTPESVPMAISEHLSQVQLAVRSIVGNEIFAGATFDENDLTNSRITIYGTDVDAIAAALDEIATDLRDRITIAESAYSFAELRDVAGHAEAALGDIGLTPLWISTRFDGSGVDVTVKRVPDQTDEQLTSAANDSLAGLPVVVTVSDPPIPL